MATRLVEGMRGGDLEDMVLPLISVDEFQSKIGEDAIVLGFYVSERDAATDLDRFIQKSSAGLVDSEVSPAPDQHGWFMVFVELPRNLRLPEMVKEVIDEISPLVNIENWRMRIRGVERLVPFSEEAVRLHINVEKIEEGLLDRAGSMLAESAAGSIQADGDALVIEDISMRIRLVPVGIGSAGDLLTEAGLDDAPIASDLVAIAEARRIERMLGEGWTAESVADHLLLSKGENSLLVRR